MAVSSHIGVSNVTHNSATLTLYLDLTNGWSVQTNTGISGSLSCNGQNSSNTVAVHSTGGSTAICTLNVSGLAASTTYSFSGQINYKALAGITIPQMNPSGSFTTAAPPWSKPRQTYVTRSTNNTSGNIVNSNDQSIDSNWRSVQTSDKSYAGDSFTFWWDKNNPNSLGTNAHPWSYADLINSNNTNIHSAWGSHGGGNDRYHTHGPINAPADWAGHNIRARIVKEYRNSGGTVLHYEQWAGHYIQPKPTVDSDCELRSKRFYSDTPSSFVYKVNKYKITTNGYGCNNSPTNDNKAKYIADDIVPYKICLGCDANGTNKTFNALVPANNTKFADNYEVSNIDVHSDKMAQSIIPGGSALVYSNWCNPRTQAESRLGWVGQTLDKFDIISGSIDLADITKIEPISGNGTTVILKDLKKLYTNQENCNITWKVTNEGNTNGFGYDIRETGDTGLYASANFGMNQPTSLASDNWKTDVTSMTTTVTHKGLTHGGDSRSTSAIPFVTDSAGYKIFGNKNSTYFTGDVYNMILIKVPSGISFDKWENTLPAIDGVKDIVKYECTSPSDWGNVVDFTYGYKMRYKIGSDTSRYDGYQWEFITTPTSVDTKFSGQFEQTYDRSLNTKCAAQLTATSYYSSVWDAYLAFQSPFTTELSYDIAAKKPYNQTKCTIDTIEYTTLDTEVSFKLTCPDQVINGNTLVQTTTLKIDDSTIVTIDNPQYTTDTPNSLSGDLNLAFRVLSQKTPALARGAHTLYVENEVVTYFDSISPSNHVYFGTTTLKSDVLDIEVAELPLAPTIKTPNPAYFNAGQARTLKWEFVPKDWGCLDTAYNDRRFEYELIDPLNEKIAGGYLVKTATSWSHNITPISPDNDGDYKFRLREVTVVGSSPWSENIIQIYRAEEPGCETLEVSDVIALPNWDWEFTLTPGDNGSYKSR